MATTAKTGNRPYSSKPRRKPVASDFDDPGRAPTPAERRAMDKEQSAPYRESYEAGQKAGQAEGQQTSGTKAAAGKAGAGARKKPARRRPVPGARSARTAARQLQAPVRAQITSGVRIVGVSLALVALYNILVPPGPDAFTGVLRGFSQALTWLSAPTPFPKKH